MGYINGMIVQSEVSRPHVAYIMETLAKTFPNVIWIIGGKVNRTTWSGGFSFHSEGRACDTYLDANDRLDKKLGDLLFKMFSTYAYDFKVDHTIRDGQIWSRAQGGPAAYTGGGGPHRDHVHVAFINHHLDDLPTGFPWICDRVAEMYVLGSDGAADRFDGLYGKAFDPKRPNVRLSHKQRHMIMLKNMVSTDRPPSATLSTITDRGCAHPLVPAVAPPPCDRPAANLAVDLLVDRFRPVQQGLRLHFVPQAVHRLRGSRKCECGTALRPVDADYEVAQLAQPCARLPKLSCQFAVFFQCQRLGHLTHWFRRSSNHSSNN